MTEICHSLLNGPQKHVIIVGVAAVIKNVSIIVVVLL